MKKRLVSFFTIIVLILLGGCGKDTPNATANSFLKALKKYDINTMAECVDSFPKIESSVLTYDIFSAPEYTETFQLCYSSMRFSVQSVTETDNTATVEIKGTHPNLSDAYATAMYTVAANIFSDESLYNMVQDENADLTGLIPQEMRKMYENGKIENKESAYKLTLKKSENGWRISDDDELRNLMTCDLYKNVKSTIESISGSSEDTEEKVNSRKELES